MKTGLAVLAGLSLVLCACSAQPTPTGPVKLEVRCGPDGQLASLTLNGRVVDRARGEAVDAFVKRAFGKIPQEVEIEGSRDTPYRCIGGAIFTMQLLGARKAGFVSVPSSEEGRR